MANLIFLFIIKLFFSTESSISYCVKSTIMLIYCLSDWPNIQIFFYFVILREWEIEFNIFFIFKHKITLIATISLESRPDQWALVIIAIVTQVSFFQALTFAYVYHVFFYELILLIIKYLNNFNWIKWVLYLCLTFNFSSNFSSLHFPESEQRY